VRYWVGLRVPIQDRDRPRPGPATLLVMSDSLRGGGLFFDLTPWIIVAFSAVFFSVLFWIPLVRGMTRSLSRMTRATEQIAEGRFDTRVATRRTDELGRLGAAIDHLAARLAGFVTGQKRFLGDTAHELCSPIARMHVALGILEQRADEKQKSYVNDVREEAQHMSNLVNELLSFSKASLGTATIQLQPVPVRAMVSEVIRRETMPGADLTADVSEDLSVLAEPELLKRALANLVRNALRYAGQSGRITIAARRQNGRVALTVSDAGPGVPEPHLAQLFDPFYRVDTSRARETGGVGLGLTIVKSCVEACGGTVVCRNLKPTGFEAEIALKSS
jgi:two-component system sensor histidine kinase CpxA